MSEKRYHVAVVGCGRIGVTMEQDPKQMRPATHAAAFSSHPACTLSALVDVDPEKRAAAERLYAGVPTYEDVSEMLERDGPDVVCVATPPSQHRPVVEFCAKAGVRAVVCEKPIAETLTEGRAMIEACAKNGSLLFINHTRRFDPLIRRTRDELRAGMIGEILQATCYYTAGIMNTGTHIVDLLRFVLGEVSWVAGYRSACPSHGPGDENVDVVMETVAGVRVSMQVLDVKDYSIFDLRLYGRSGSAALTRSGYEIERAGLCERSDVSGLHQLDTTHSRREGRPRSFMGPMAEHVVACLDGKDTPVSLGEDGLAALTVLKAIRTSAARGGERVELLKTEI